MFLDIIAPWIFDAWAEFVAALVFDLPTLDLNAYEAHALVALVSAALLLISWNVIAHLPAGARIPVRGFMACVLLVPAVVFGVHHFEEMQSSRVVSVEAPPPAQPPVGATAPPRNAELTPAAPARQPLPEATALTASPPPVATAPTVARAMPAVAPSGAIPPSDSQPVIIAKEADPDRPVSAGADPAKANSGPMAAGTAVVKRVVATLSRLQTKPEQDLMPVFYGTDRSSERTASDRLDYSAQQAQRLELGRALVRIPRGRQSSETQRPWVVAASRGTPASPTGAAQHSADRDGSDHLAIHEIAALSHDEFLEATVLRLAQSRTFKDHALVFVHGFNTSFESAVLRAGQMAYDLKFDGAPFVYSWPSAGRVARYGYDSDSAHQAAPYLKAFLRLVIAETGARSISVVTHGLGAGPTLEVLEQLKVDFPAGVELRELVVAAPDLDCAAFIKQARELAGTAHRITLYAASSDRALNITRRYTGSTPRAGDVIDGRPLVIPSVDTVDMSAPGTDAIALNHAGYVTGGPLLADMAKRLAAGRAAGGAVLTTDAVVGAETVTTANGSYLRYLPPAKTR